MILMHISGKYNHTDLVCSTYLFLYPPDYAVFRVTIPLVIQYQPDYAVVTNTGYPETCIYHTITSQFEYLAEIPVMQYFLFY